MNTVVSLKGVSKEYKLGKTAINAVTNINLEINKGDFLCIAGPSGSGKTTLLNIIGCLDTPTSGSVKIAGQAINSLSSDNLADIRNRYIGFIFQTFNLIPVLTTRENVEFPLLLSNKSREDINKKVNTLLEAVGIYNYADHRPDELSGGQRQRVAIARAMVAQPQIIIADEPTANLDSKTGDMIIKLMLELNKKSSTTFIFSTHDEQIMKCSTQLIRIYDGVINGAT